MSGPFRGFLRGNAADVGLAIGMAAELEPPVERGMVGEQDVREKQEIPARHLSAEVHAVERIGVAADEATGGMTCVCSASLKGVMAASSERRVSLVEGRHDWVMVFPWPAVKVLLVAYGATEDTPSATCIPKPRIA